ncbi:PEP-CTERM sorting domain-containing protein [Scytonema sp. NUACC26]|uniref:PEP-CTERM sorting domain-containing protein n=1 Tax=Scytonema sp. NUACC26 TaxID=3140176 RepID=UPI0034DC0EA2
MLIKTVLKSLLKSSKKKVVALTILGLSNFAVASPSHAAGISFDTSDWDAIGDVSQSSSQAQLTNAFDATDDGGTDRRVSGKSAVETFDIETFLGFTPGTLDTNFTEGSAIARTFNNVMAGDVISFDLGFDTLDSGDRAFVAIDNQISYQTTNTSFRHTFSTPGNFKVSIGILDFNDFTNSSRLTVRNGNLQPVPEPLTILGSMTALGLGVSLRQRFRKSGNGSRTKSQA